MFGVATRSGTKQAFLTPIRKYEVGSVLKLRHTKYNLIGKQHKRAVDQQLLVA